MVQKVRVGDVFLVPIDDAIYGLGQVAGDWKGELYIVIYDALSDGRDISPRQVMDAQPLFAGLSLDAKLYHGEWRVIGNVVEKLENIPQPVFKVMQGESVFWETRDRSATAQASTSQAEYLRFRKVVAPVRLEKALKAHYGVGEWQSQYDELEYRYAWESAQVLAGL